MILTQILQPTCIKAPLDSTEKENAIQELVTLLASTGQITDPDTAYEAVMDREQQRSTGIGAGIAIPHGKLKELPGIICSFGRSREGIDFQAIDEKPSHLFFLLLAPEDSASEHLQALARLSRLLKDAQFRKRLMEATSKEEIYRLITEEDNHYELP